MRSSGSRPCIARSNACRVPEPRSRTIQAAARRSRSVSARLRANGWSGAQNTTSSSSRQGVTSSSGSATSPSIRPTSISKLPTWRAISSVLATVSVTSAAGMLAHEARHQRHRQVVADGQRRADAQPRRFFLALEPALELARLVEHRLGARAQRAAEVAELQALADAIEQLHVELALEIGQRAADGRLRHRRARARRG